MKSIKIFALVTISFMMTFCKKSDKEISNVQNNVGKPLSALTYSNENFETGGKTAYAIGNVTLTTGSWSLDDALTGNSSSDVKNGSWSARVRNSGILSMNFDKTTGAGTITINHAKYGADASTTWELWYSTNSGTSYTKSGSAVTTSSTSLSSASFTLNVTGNVRIQIKKTDASTNRLNIDDITINDYSGTLAAPTLSALSSTSCTAGASAFTLTTTGTNFTSSSTINWNGTALTTTYNSGTSLSATISSSLVSSAGTASVTVTNATGTSSGLTFTINAASTSTGRKFLFDATKAETAGNADWILDNNSGSIPRIPTPAQSGITSTTAQSYWTGALSAWGVALVKLGHTVETLSSGTSITYGNSSNAQDLSNYNAYIIDEPNTLFSSSEKTAILNYVYNGGGLFIICDHNGSDRNSDGYDSRAVLNDLFTNNSIVSNPFGFSIDATSFSQTSTNVLSSSTNPIINGSAGSVSSIQWSSGASITINSSANSTVQGLIWKSSVTQNSSNLLVASAIYGTGRVVIVGDSSPADDGSGTSGKTLYNGWGVGSSANLHINASLWIAK